MLERIVDGRTDLVFEYLKAGYPADSKDANGVSLIKWCAYYGDVSAIRHLLNHGESLHSLGENYDLNGAAFHGHWHLCQYLLENGANANHPLPDTGETPLHAALCKTNQPTYDHVVQVLLANGADPNRPTKPGVETGSFMRDCRTKGETPLHRAAAFASEETIRMLLDAGATIDAKDTNGDTPLAWASWYCRPDFILQQLCYGEHTIHPDRVKQSRTNQSNNRLPLEIHLLGKPHMSGS